MHLAWFADVAPLVQEVEERQVQATLRSLSAAAGRITYENIAQIIQIGHRYSYSDVIQTDVCKAIWAVATWRHKPGCLDVVKAGGLKVLANAMDYHQVWPRTAQVQSCTLLSVQACIIMLHKNHT